MNFLSLTATQQAEVRTKQKQSKQRKQNQKKIKSQQKTISTTDLSLSSPFPSIISQQEYFNASPQGLFRHPQIKANAKGIRLLFMNLESTLQEQGEQQGIGAYNYYMFSGNDKEVWNPTFNANLAWEGFFTITHGSQGGLSSHLEEVPLPELQPYYGVLLWTNFETSKYVKKEISKLKSIIHINNSDTTGSSGDKKYVLINCKNEQRTWELLNKYHVQKHGSNWLTRKYFKMMKQADMLPNINFNMHCIELYDDAIDPERNNPLSGEIGFSIGKVYTSLSGWTEERTAEGTGTTQLVLLGRWLQKKNYSFWSLGHCYSPAMDYKRQLGHRIFPRTHFLALLKQHRGDFEISSSNSSASTSSSGDGGGEKVHKIETLFAPLQKNESIDMIELVNEKKWIVNALSPLPLWTTSSNTTVSTSKKVRKKNLEPKGGSQGMGIKKVKPNAKCPCGSGKKFKKCCR
tara:strand:- start:1807 stop:3186 length:1380 start_codon:yes stop_codon:yes gene_type:complete